MKRFTRLASALFAVLLLCSLLTIPAAAETLERETTILFTHDLHSHFLPVETTEGGQSGGYARLKTLIDREKAVHPDALVLDAGDFSIGSLVQTLYATHAAELRTMGMMGYDVTTIGNHELDHRGMGFARMLNAAKEAQEAALGLMASSQLPLPTEDYREQYGPLTTALPAMVSANYRPAQDNPDRELISAAMENYGVQETLLLERGGVTYGIFGLMGVDSDDCAPVSGFALEEPAAAAKRCVESLKAQGAEFIICLSHSGTDANQKKSEDEQLAKAVGGIDVIISGHTHTTLDQPIVVNGTYIVSAGPYCQNLGSITLRRTGDGSLRLVDYRLLPIDGTVAEDAETAALIEEWKAIVGDEYLGCYGLTYDQVLTTTAFDITKPRYGVQEGNTLGELVSDAFRWAYMELAQDNEPAFAVTVTADGVLRASLTAGEITASDAFDVLSLGVGEDGTAGYPLVAVYLTGKELKAAMEVDASVTPIMPAAQLYMSGVGYSFNTNRMFFNRVTDAALRQPPFMRDFSRQEYLAAGVAEIDDGALYKVVTGMYSAQMLGTVKDKSMGLLSLVPKDAQGNPITDFTDCILYDKDGNELKEWYALAAYLRSFGEDGVDAWYAQPDGRKLVSGSWSPAVLFTNLNWISWLVIGVILAVILLLILLLRFILRRRNMRKV